jgi:hypothetical protein
VEGRWRWSSILEIVAGALIRAISTIWLWQLGHSSPSTESERFNRLAHGKRRGRMVGESPGSSFAWASMQAWLTVPNRSASPARGGSGTIDATGNYTATCSYLGGCDEYFTITGTFTDNDNWTGTFEADYVGSCADCVYTSWNLTGVRTTCPCP